MTPTPQARPGGFTVDGSDNQCGAAKLAGAAGMALFNPDGTVGLEFTIVTAPSPRAVHVSASVNPGTGNGSWTDSVGNSGAFPLAVSGTGSPRPLPASGLGTAVITTTEIAANAVGASDINATEVQARVSGTCPAGQTMTGINQNGSVSCSAPPVELLAAWVSGTATILAGSGATGALKLGTGIYEVQFNRDVSQCFYSASTYIPNQVAHAVEPRAGNANAVFLQIGNFVTPTPLVDGSFHVTVFCPRP